MRTRIDCLSAVLIDAIVSNYRARSIRSAADALARNHVSLEVALRVLTRPWQRRVALTSSPGFRASAKRLTNSLTDSLSDSLSGSLTDRAGSASESVPAGPFLPQAAHGPR